MLEAIVKNWELNAAIHFAQSWKLHCGPGKKTLGEVWEGLKMARKSRVRKHK